MNKEKFTNVKFCRREGASKAINDPFFSHLDEFDNETFEVILIFLFC